MAVDDEERLDVTATEQAPSSPRPAGTAAPRVDLAELLPNCNPSEFELGAEIGRGGIGRVLRGRDPVFDRPIAIKELLSTGSAPRARFLREAMITARLQHPAIVPVYLAGRWPDGSPFYGMKLVEGKPMSEALRERETLEERISLLPAVIATCEAIAFAHRHRIIHRDLKPSNVLLGDLGETVVIDWGLAKDLDEADDPAGTYGAVATATETIDGAVLGTPAYMPPEQGAGKPVDERGDVYSLGAILYELLAGAMPYADSKSPRAILAALAERRPDPIRALSPQAPLDLIAIAERAMARDPAARYPDAAALAADLRRFQTGQLVSVRDYGRLERLGRWMRKHRAAVGVGAAALVALIVVGVVGFVGTVRAQHRAEDAARAEAIERARAEHQRDEAVIANAAAIVRDDPAASIELLSTLSSQSAQWKAARTIAADAYAERVPELFPDPGFRVESLALAADERSLAAFAGRQVVVYDLVTKGMKRIELPANQLISRISPDLRFVTGVGDVVSSVRVADGVTTSYDTGGAKTVSTSVSADGRWLAAIGATKLYVWPVSGGPARVIDTEASSWVELDDDGTLYALGRDRSAVLISAADDTTRRVALPVSRIAQFQTWRRVVVLTPDGHVAVVDVATGRVQTLPSEARRFDDFILNKDGSSIVGRALDHNVRWEPDAAGEWQAAEVFAPRDVRKLVGAASMEVEATGVSLRRAGGPILGRFPVVAHPLELTRDASTLFATTANGTIARWDLTGGDATLCGPESYIGVASNRALLQRGEAGKLLVCDPRTRTQRTLLGGTQMLQSAITSTTFRFAVSRGDAGEIVVWDIAGGVGHVLATTGTPLAITEDGGRVMVADGGQLFAVDVATTARTPRCSGFAIEATRVSEDATRAVQSAALLEVCDLDRNEVRTLPGYPGDRHMGSLQLSGSLAFANGTAGPVLWNLRTNKRYPLDAGTRDRVTAAEIADDDRGVVIASQRFAAVFDAEGRLVGKVARAGVAPSGVTVSPDLRRIVTTDFAEHARLFDLDSQRSRVLAGYSGGRDAGFFDDGRLIVTVDTSRRMYVFADPMPSSANALRAQIVKTASAIDLDPEGRAIRAR